MRCRLTRYSNHAVCVKEWQFALPHAGNRTHSMALKNAGNIRQVITRRRSLSSPKIISLTLSNLWTLTNRCGQTYTRKIV